MSAYFRDIQLTAPINKHNLQHQDTQWSKKRFSISAKRTFCWTRARGENEEEEPEKEKDYVNPLQLDLAV